MDTRKATRIRAYLRSGARSLCCIALLIAVCAESARAQKTARPVLQGRHWVAVTGKPLAATAGAEIVRAGRAHGGLFTMQDLDRWQVHIEEPGDASTSKAIVALAANPGLVMAAPRWWKSG